jgi:hypothetical protein
VRVPVARRGCSKKQKAKPGEWIPAEYALPDLETLERLSGGEGEPIQRQLFVTQGNGLEELRQKLKQS